MIFQGFSYFSPAPDCVFVCAGVYREIWSMKERGREREKKRKREGEREGEGERKKEREKEKDQKKINTNLILNLTPRY